MSSRIVLWSFCHLILMQPCAEQTQKINECASACVLVITVKLHTVNSPDKIKMVNPHIIFHLQLNQEENFFPFGNRVHFYLDLYDTNQSLCDVFSSRGSESVNSKLNHICSEQRNSCFYNSGKLARGTYFIFHYCDCVVNGWNPAFLLPEPSALASPLHQWTDPFKWMSVFSCVLYVGLNTA